MAREEAAQVTRRSGLGRDLAILAVVGVLLIAALGAGGAVLYQQFYSPSAFVRSYLSLLSGGRAADALAVPGVSVDSAELTEAGLPTTASDALLRRAALAALSDVTVISERFDGAIAHVTVSYRAGSIPGRTTFEVERNGWIGVAPAWRFASSPLAVMDLTVLGSMRFDVNGFEIDKRQVSTDGVDVDPMAPVQLLVFSPGVYSVSVDTAISASPGSAVLSDAPLADIPVDVQAQPTEEFVKVVQQRVDEFLTTCATQQVLQPTGCPFGFIVQNRIDDLPTWSIVAQPVVTVVPDGANWRIPAAAATAHIEVDVRSLFDGSIDHVSQDVPFGVTGAITVLPDGTATIRVSGPDTN